MAGHLIGIASDRRKHRLLQGNDGHGDDTEEADTGTHAGGASGGDRRLRGSSGWVGDANAGAGDGAGLSNSREGAGGERSRRDSDAGRGGNRGVGGGLGGGGGHDRDPGGAAGALADGGEADLGHGQVRADDDSAAGGLAGAASARDHRRGDHLNRGVHRGRGLRGRGRQDSGDLREENSC